MWYCSIFCCSGIWFDSDFLGYEKSESAKDLVSLFYELLQFLKVSCELAVLRTRE